MIRLQFVSGDDLSSDAIAWFSQGHVSHVDYVMPDGRLLGARNDFTGGQHPGVRIRPPDYLKFSERVLFDLAATPAQEAAFMNFLSGQVGKPYDTRAIWGFVFGRDWRERDSWICSELQAAALEYAGICPPLYLAANKVTPVALALVASALGAVQS